MNGANKVLYVRNIDESLQGIIDTYKKKFNSKSEAKVVRRMINDFPRIADLLVNTKEELEEVQNELRILKEEKRKIIEILKLGI